MVALSGQTSLTAPNQIGTYAINGQVWQIWATSSANTSTGYGISSTAATNQIWTLWNTSANTSITTGTNHLVWDNWTLIAEGNAAVASINREARRGGVNAGMVQPASTYREPTAEQLAEWRERERLAKERAEAEAKRRLEARDRAKALLRSCLSPQQREDLEKKQCFYLESVAPDGTRKKYRIDQGTHGNVKLLAEDGKKVIGSYCVQPSGVPDEDAMLAQKLFIEGNLAEFERRANFRRHA